MSGTHATNLQLLPPVLPALAFPCLQVQLKRRGDDEKYMAKVLAVGTEADLALLTGGWPGMRAGGCGRPLLAVGAAVGVLLRFDGLGSMPCSYCCWP